jgi:porin
MPPRTLTVAGLLLMGCSAQAWAQAQPDPVTTAQDTAPATPQADEATRWPMAWSQPLIERGITPQASFTIDYSKNLRGGADTQGEALRHLFTFALTLDTEKLIDLPGGTFFISFVTQAGANGSDEVGDYQAFDNLDSQARTQINELWYEQIFGEDLVKLRAGKLDVSCDFAWSEYGGPFLNSSTGVSPTILSLPTYPDTAVGIDAFVTPVDWLYFGAGLFDGAAQEGKRTGTLGTQTLVGEPADLFLIAELGLLWSLDEEDTLPGRLAIGGWHHTGSFDRFDGGRDDHANGFYLPLDQRVWTPRPRPRNETDPDGQTDAHDEESSSGVGLFFQYGQADEQVSEVAHHLGAGLLLQGPLPGRSHDATGIAIEHVIFTDQAGAGFTDDSETALEIFYRAQITDFFWLTPDLQYIFNPGGAGLNDALVATIRAEVVF